MEKVIRASLDRIEGGFAIIYPDYDDHHHTQNRFEVPLKLVKDAKPGMRLQLYMENNQIKRIEIDKEATDRARDRIHKKYERLRQGRHLKRQ
ncbi:MAG: DUF3006 domain-containing protein [Thermoproteota archaeon]|nr:DUF3006 domain-containing protein [Thermoproteota archaeon]